VPYIVGARDENGDSKPRLVTGDDHNGEALAVRGGRNVPSPTEIQTAQVSAPLS